MEDFSMFHLLVCILHSVPFDAKKKNLDKNIFVLTFFLSSSIYNKLILISLLCIIHVSNRFSEPVSTWRTDFGSPWWRDEKLCIGSLSQSTRNIRIVNTLTHQEALLEVCSEETMEEILDRYLDHNSHASSYTWKTLDEGDFRPLDMNKTLEKNGIPNESDAFESLRIADDYYTPVVHLYFDDDLTVA